MDKHEWKRAWHADMLFVKENDRGTRCGYVQSKKNEKNDVDKLWQWSLEFSCDDLWILVERFTWIWKFRLNFNRFMN